MKQQDYILRKIVRAKSAAEALKQDRRTPVHEVFQRDYDENKHLESAIGFATVHPDEGDEA